MANKSLEDIFEDQYPKLPEQLMEAGITTLALLNQKVFNQNETYFFEVLGFDMEDNDRIMNILRMENTEDVLESFIVSSVDSRFGSDALKAILLLFMGLVVILVFIISLIN